MSVVEMLPKWCCILVNFFLNVKCQLQRYEFGLACAAFVPAEQVWVSQTLRSKASRCWKEHGIPMMVELPFEEQWKQQGGRCDL